MGCEPESRVGERDCKSKPKLPQCPCPESAVAVQPVFLYLPPACPGTRAPYGNAGCLGSRLTHLNAGTEFFQKNFSAAGRPFSKKYDRMIAILVFIRSIGVGVTGIRDQPAAKTM